MMAESVRVPELKQILGAMVFGANRPLRISEMRKCLQEVAEAEGGELRVFAQVKDAGIRTALEELGRTLDEARVGCQVREVAGGYRLQSDAACGVWIRNLLSLDRPTRLSQPALETLAIIAYRQPVARAQIEAVRGVNVDHMVRMLLEVQLVRITGRSELPGRPFLYGTTQRFLEHFGLKDLKQLSEIDPALMASGELSRRKSAPAPIELLEGEALPEDVEAAAEEESAEQNELDDPEE